jgi:hypothetical protein
LNSTGHGDNISHVTVDLVNPFTSDLKITEVQSRVQSHGINLGGINQTVVFDAMGHQTTTSPNLSFDLNLDPVEIFSVTRKLATLAGLGTEQLDGIVALGGYQYVTTTDDDDAPAASSLSTQDSRNTTRLKRDENIFTGFNLPNFIDTAFKQLRADVELTSSVSIGKTSLERILTTRLLKSLQANIIPSWNTLNQMSPSQQMRASIFCYPFSPSQSCRRLSREQALGMLILYQ